MTLGELINLLAEKEMAEQMIVNLQQNKKSYKINDYESELQGLQTYLEELLETPISGDGD